MADMDTECLTEFLKGKGIELDDFKKMDHKSDEYKKAYEGYEEFFDEWLKKRENKKEEPEKPAVVNEDFSPTPETPDNGNWKEDVLKEWQEWSNKNNKVLATYEDPEQKDNLSFRIYASKEAQAKNDFEADFAYSGPRNVTLKGKDGQVPADEYFDKLVAQLKAENGPQIEFGNIKSEEFKAKLLAACLRDKEIEVVKGPSPQEISAWPKELQDKVAAATETRETRETPKKEEEKFLLYDAAKKVVETTFKDKTELDIENLKPEDKVLYMAAAMELKGKEIGEGQFTIKGALSAQEALNVIKSLPEEERTKVSPGMVKYKIYETQQKLAEHKKNMSKEQQDSMDLRQKYRSGDSKAREEMDKRRANTMTDEYKYVRETEMEADGKTPKADEKGNPIYKKDKDGKFVYKTDDKGNRIETPHYQAIKQRLNSYGNNK